MQVQCQQLYIFYVFILKTENKWLWWGAHHLLMGPCCYMFWIRPLMFDVFPNDALIKTMLSTLWAFSSIKRCLFHFLLKVSQCHYKYIKNTIHVLMTTNIKYQYHFNTIHTTTIRRFSILWGIIMWSTLLILTKLIIKVLYVYISLVNFCQYQCAHSMC